MIDSRYLDLPSLISWITSQQRTPVGGFAGRTNKLVDGCYSHWMGNCFHFIEEALLKSGQSHSVARNPIWNREGLIRYILGCCQQEGGGLRDKPSK
jgi:protein farnesyltransferase subunit beta